MIVYFRNPANNHRELVTGNFTWLWSLLFGPFYFGYKGAWGHAILGMIAGIATLGLSWFVYPFFAKRIVQKRYAEMGWIREDAA